MMYETMSKAEIEAIRENFSKAKNSLAWTKTPGEMYKKTVLRRLCKLIEKDFDSAEQRKVYHEEVAEVDFDQEKTVEVSPFDDIIIDAEFEDVKEPKEQQEEPKSKPKTEKLELSVEDAKAKQG